MGERDKPIVYPTELEAQRAVTKHLLDYFNVDYLTHGERATSAKSEAEKLFGCLISKGRKIHIERKAARI